MGEYRAVQRDLHSHYVLVILRRERWRIDGSSNRGKEQGVSGRPVDLIPAPVQSFLRFEVGSGEVLELRLDSIREVGKGDGLLV